MPRRVPQWVAFFDELENAGFVEGKKLIVDWRFIGFGLEQTAALLGEPVERAPDMLVPGAAGLAVAKAATRGRHDRERAGPLVRPTGCNLTGASIMATQLGGKRLEILTELVPAPTPYSRTRRSNLDGAASPRCSPKRRRIARGRAAIYPVHRPRRSRQLSTERRSPTPRHSTCRRRPSSTAIVNHIGPERPAATSRDLPMA